MQPQSQDRRVNSFFDINRLLDVYYKVLRGNVSFGSVGVIDNMSGAMFSGTSPAIADTEFNIAHNLQKIPIGFLVLRRDKAGVFYDSGTTWTTSKIFLKCNVASVAYVIFVLT